MFFQLSIKIYMILTWDPFQIRLIILIFHLSMKISVQFSGSVVSNSATPWTAPCWDSLSMKIHWGINWISVQFSSVTQSCHEVLLYAPSTEIVSKSKLVGWRHRLDGHDFEQAPGVGDGQGGLACCGPWGRKDSDRSERLNWTEQGFPGGSVVKSLSANARDVGSIPGLGSSYMLWRNEASESQLRSLGSRAGELQPLSRHLTITEAREA